MSTENVDRGDDIKTTGKPEVDKVETKKPEVKDEVKDELKTKAVESDEDETADEGKGADADDDADDGDAHKEEAKPKKTGADRFKELSRKARERERELIAQIEELKGSKKGDEDAEMAKQVKAYRGQIETLKDKYEDLLHDGKKDEARSIRRQYEAMEHQLREYEVASKAEIARTRAEENTAYSAKLERVEEQHPELNPTSDVYDEELAQDVAVMVRGYHDAGLPMAQALDRAVKKLLGKVAPAASGVDTLKQKREEEARKKAADAAKKSPPSTRGAGLDSDKAGASAEKTVDVGRLTMKEFEKLSEEQLAKLRGDAL